MNKNMNSEQSDLYRAPDFRRRVSFALACEQSDVDVAFDRLLAAGRIPMVGRGMPADIAIWADAARMVAAVAGQKLLPTATAAFAERIVGMARRIPPDSIAGAPAVTHSFGSEIASLLRHRLPRAGALGVPTVSVSCSDGAVALYGKIDFGGSGAPSLRYRDVSPGVEEAVAGGRWPAAIRVSFPPSSLVGMGDVLNESVAASRAALATEGSTL